MSDKTQSNSKRELFERAQAVKRAHEEELLARPNVVGLGVGLMRRGGALTEDVGIIVLVSRKLPSDELSAPDLIPAELEGVPVDVQEAGEIRAQ